MTNIDGDEDMEYRKSFLPAAKPTGLGEHLTPSPVVRRPSSVVISSFVAQARAYDFLKVDFMVTSR